MVMEATKAPVAGEPELGDKVKDVVTGFAGIAGARIKYLHGCDRIGIEPTKLDKDGNPQEMRFFDLDRVEVEKRGEIPRASHAKPQAAAPRKPGGPRNDPVRCSRTI